MALILTQRRKDAEVRREKARGFELAIASAFSPRLRVFASKSFVSNYARAATMSGFSHRINVAQLSEAVSSM